MIVQEAEKKRRKFKFEFLHLAPKEDMPQVWLCHMHTHAFHMQHVQSVS